MTTDLPISPSSTPDQTPAQPSWLRSKIRSVFLIFSCSAVMSYWLVVFAPSISDPTLLKIVFFYEELFGMPLGLSVASIAGLFALHKLTSSQRFLFTQKNTIKKVSAVTGFAAVFGAQLMGCWFAALLMVSGGRIVLTLSYPFRAQDSGAIITATAQIAQKLPSLPLPLTVGPASQFSSEFIADFHHRHEKWSPFFSQTLVHVLTPVSNQLLAQTTTPTESVFLYGNGIFFNQLEKESVQEIVPIIAKIGIQSHFAPRSIQDSPDLVVLGKQEYIQFRDELVDQQINDVKKEIQTVQRAITNLINSQKRIIESVNAGQMDIQSAQLTLAKREKSLRELQENLQVLEFQVKLIESQKQNATHELGLFVFKDKKIKVVLERTDPEYIYELLAIVVHEYLHYTSYINEDRQLPLFFEEGLTEHFTREVLQDQFGSTTHVGYPIISPVIKSMMLKANRKQMIEGYFTKDTDLIALTLDEAISPYFFQESQYHFFMIPFSDLEKGVLLANDIIQQFGGTPLSASEIKKQHEQRQF